MSKYSKKILYDYITGNEIDGYDIDELENDYIFIKEVTDISNDKKMYDLCDDKLKSNFELIKFFILKFKNDKTFIKKVAHNFSILSNNEDDKFEIDIIVSELLGKDYSSISENVSYISAKSKYNGLRTAYILDSRNDSQEVKDYYQMGFDYFADVYAGRVIVIDYIAKNMVNEIFSEEDYSLEELIHSKFKDKEKIEKIGVTNFILLYVESYDSHLANYLKTNIEIIEKIKKDLEKIISNFDKYNETKRNNIMHWIVEYLNNYSLETNYLSGTQLIKYISKDLNITDSILEKEFDEEDTILDEFDYPRIKSDFQYLKLKDKVREALKTLKEPDDYVEKKEKEHKCKILIFENIKK